VVIEPVAPDDPLAPDVPLAPETPVAPLAPASATEMVPEQTPADMPTVLTVTVRTAGVL
jgi:hypothetical protein